MGQQRARQTEANSRMSRNGSNRVELFIDYLYLHFTVENIPEHINGCSECMPEPGSRRGSTEAQTMEGSSALEGKRENMQEGEEFPYSLSTTVE